MDERTEEQRATATPLTFVVGGERREVPVLTISESRSWKQKLAEKFAGLFNDAADVTALVESGEYLTYTDDMALDLVMAYDKTGVLGSRDEILETCTDRQLFDIFKAMQEESFPLGDWQAGISAQVVRYLRQNSGNGHSATGLVSDHKVSARSRTGSSTSSGRKRSSG